METMKSYTSLEQSKQLAKILPLKSADMRYSPLGDIHPWFLTGTLIEKDAVPCWSLAALLGLLPNYTMINNGYSGIVIWSSSWNSNEHDNPVDACVDLLFKLHKQNLL